MSSIPSPKNSLETLHSTSSSSTAMTDFSASSNAAYTQPCTSSPTKKYPPLEDILANKAPHPYNLDAFMSFLSQNHCLETVEFTMDVAKYTELFDSNQVSKDVLLHMWNRVVDTYIRPDGAKELNLTCQVRSQLIKLRPASPPSPDHLAYSLELVKDMIKENAYLPFITSIRCASFQPSAAAIPRRNSDQPASSIMTTTTTTTTTTTISLQSSDYYCMPPFSLPAISPFESNRSNRSSQSADSSVWHQPVSWTTPTPTETLTLTSISKSSSSSIDSIFACDDESSFVRGKCDSPVTPPHSPSETCTHEFCSQASTIQHPSVSMPDRPHGHWRRMSKRLKWRRGSEKSISSS